MFRQHLVLITLAILSTRPEHVSTASLRASELLDLGFSSIGGRAAYRDLAGVRVVFSRSSHNAGQEEWVGAESALATVMDGIEFRDYRRPGLLTRYHLPNSPRTFTRLFLSDSAAFLFDTIVAGFGAVTPSRGYLPILREDPTRILRAIAGAPDAAARTLGTRQLLGRRALGVEVLAAEDTVRLWIDAKSNVPLAIERVADDPVSGTRVTLIALANWIATGSVRIPGSVVVTDNGRILETQSILQAQANASFDSAFASVPKRPSSPLSSVITVAELAPGVFRAEGSPNGVPYNSVFARVGDSVFVFDPPLNDRYATAIIDTVKGRFPSARARMFVVSHHHVDHASGARAAFAAGMSAIASAEIADYVRGLGVPAGRKAPNNRRVTAVEDTLAIGTGASRFVLYHVPTSHARGLLIAYFPEAKLISEVDLAAGLPQHQRDLYDFVTKRGIVVEKLARMHGPVTPWANFAQPFQK